MFVIENLGEWYKIIFGLNKGNNYNISDGDLFQIEETDYKPHEQSPFTFVPISWKVFNFLTFISKFDRILPSFERIVHFTNIFWVQVRDIELMQIINFSGISQNLISFLFGGNKTNDLIDNLRVKHWQIKNIQSTTLVWSYNRQKFKSFNFDIYI